MKSEQMKIVTMFFSAGQEVRVIQPGAKAWNGKVVSECNGRPGWYYVRSGGWTDLVHFGDLEAL